MATTAAAIDIPGSIYPNSLERVDPKISSIQGDLPIMTFSSLAKEVRPLSKEALAHQWIERSFWMSSFSSGDSGTEPTPHWSSSSFGTRLEGSLKSMRLPLPSCSMN